MKKIIILILLIINHFNIFAQANEQQIKMKIDSLEKQKKEIESQIENQNNLLPKPINPAWTTKGNLSVNLGQTNFSNWSQGGTSNFNLLAIGHLEKNYSKNRLSFLNAFDANLGFQKNYDLNTDENFPIFKNADFFNLNSALNYKISEKGYWYYSFILNFRSQFFKTWDQSNSELLISDFMAPGVLELNPGITYIPNSYFSVFFSPIVSKFTFVLNDKLISNSEGAFGNIQNEKVRTEIGAKLEAKFEKELVKNLTFRSRLQLFDNYFRTDKDPLGNSRKWNVDLMSISDLFYKVSKNIALNVNLNLLYDDDIYILDKNTQKTRPTLQIKESFGIGMVYGF